MLVLPALLTAQFCSCSISLRSLAPVGSSTSFCSLSCSRRSLATVSKSLAVDLELLRQVLDLLVALGVLDVLERLGDAVAHDAARLVCVGEVLLDIVRYFADVAAKCDELAVDGGHCADVRYLVRIVAKVVVDSAETDGGDRGDCGHNCQHAGEAHTDLGADLAVGEEAGDSPGSIGVPRIVVERHGLGFPCWWRLAVRLGVLSWSR